MTATRRLAAILAADIVGYSRLMGLNEAGTAQAVCEPRAAADPIIAEHGGRVFKTTGDGLLIEFGSVVGAVECALALQHLAADRNAEVAPDRRMEWRIGVHLGDMLIEAEDILRDGVNIAARRSRVQFRRAAQGDRDFFPVFSRDEWRFEVEVTGLREAGRRRRARVKCSSALSNDRASDDYLGIKIASACCGNVSFDVPIASPSLAREETKRA